MAVMMIVEMAVVVGVGMAKTVMMVVSVAATAARAAAAGWWMLMAAEATAAMVIEIAASNHGGSSSGEGVGNGEMNNSTVPAPFSTLLLVSSLSTIRGSRASPCAQIGPCAAVCSALMSNSSSS